MLLSPAYIDIRTVTVRECTDLISYSLCEIFNLSIITGVFPEVWRCSKVIPLSCWNKVKERIWIIIVPFQSSPLWLRYLNGLSMINCTTTSPIITWSPHINQVEDLFTQRLQLYLMQLIIGLITLIKDIKAVVFLNLWYDWSWHSVI